MTLPRNRMPVFVRISAESGMSRPGDIVYLLASTIAGLITFWVVWAYFYNAEKGEPIIQIVPLFFAGAIWLLARLCRC